MWLLAEDPLLRITQPVADTVALGLWPFFLLTSFGVACILCASWLRRPNRRPALAWLGLRRPIRYPPAWFAAPLALLALGLTPGSAASSTISDSLRLFPGAMTVALGTAFVALACCYYSDWNPTRTQRRRASRSLKSHQHTQAEVPETTEELLEWLRDDREVGQPELDRFGHSEVAIRIMQRVLREHDTLPTIAVLGPPGSGKSSICSLTSHYLEAHPDLDVVQVSLWPYDQPAAAVSGILDALIAALSRHVNTLALTDVSDRYTSAMKSARGLWGVLTHLLLRPSTPDSVLRRLDAVAGASGLRLLLWIDDLERFAGADRMAGPDTKGLIAERQAPILSLLHLLDRCPSICVITADASLDARIDIEKIARYVEQPPELDSVDAWKQIRRLRERCLAEEFIDPADPKAREEFDTPRDEYGIQQRFGRMRDSEPRVQESVALLLTTPRDLKHALRSTLDAWDTLRGEIDFDHLLTASALRHAHPDIFAYINSHVALFCSGFLEFSQDQRSKEAGKKHPSRIRFEELLRDKGSKRDENALRAVISFLFPMALREYPGPVGQEGFNRPQGAFVHSHADYWQRIVSPVPVPESESDQEALRSIRDWKTGDGSDLVQRVRDEDRSHQIESFVYEFGGPQLCDLLSEAALATRRESAADWDRMAGIPFVVALHRMMRAR